MIHDIFLKFDTSLVQQITNFIQINPNSHAILLLFAFSASVFVF